MQSQHFLLKTLFKPAPSLVTWFTIDAFLFVLVMMGPFYIPFAITNDISLTIHAVIIGAVFFSFVLFFVWVRLYYNSIWYELRDDEMSWKRGVWFHTTGIVPYNRITNLDIKQGPVMRWLGISTLSIQTAGYSGQAVPEIRIEAIEHSEELRELIRSMVSGCTAVGDGTGTGAHIPKGASTSTHQQMLEELKKIRLLLEQKR